MSIHKGALIVDRTLYCFVQRTTDQMYAEAGRPKKNLCPLSPLQILTLVVVSIFSPDIKPTTPLTVTKPAFCIYATFKVAIITVTTTTHESIRIHAHSRSRTTNTYLLTYLHIVRNGSGEGWIYLPTHLTYLPLYTHSIRCRPLYQPAPHPARCSTPVVLAYLSHCFIYNLHLYHFNQRRCWFAPAIRYYIYSGRIRTEGRAQIEWRDRCCFHPELQIRYLTQVIRKYL